MTLADLIIEHGPYATGDMIRAWMLPPNLTSDALNALRDELLELRKLRAAAEARERINVFGGDDDLGNMGFGLSFPNGRFLSIDVPEGQTLTFAELVRRADEHTEGHQ